MAVIPEKMVDSGKFLEEVNRFCLETSSNYMDAVLHIAELRGIEVETAASMIKASSKAKASLQESAEELNYLPKTARLPF